MKKGDCLMRKCKVIVTFGGVAVMMLILDEEAGKCEFNNKSIGINPSILLAKIEGIISTWGQEPAIKAWVMDGMDIEVYYVSGDIEKSYTYNNLTMPDNARDLISLLEGLRD